MTKEAELINYIKEYLDSGMWHYEACYLGKEDLELIIKALERESITWVVGKDNCQVAVRNMPIDKMQKICAIIREEEQQPCEDCISRQEVIKELRGHHDFFIKSYGGFSKMPIEYKHRVDEINQCIATIVNAPPVTPSRPIEQEPKTGHWIFYHPLQADDEGAYKCSVCGYGDWGLDPEIDKFCFNCGAKMNGGNEE